MPVKNQGGYELIIYGKRTQTRIVMGFIRLSLLYHKGIFMLRL